MVAPRAAGASTGKSFLRSTCGGHHEGRDVPLPLSNSHREYLTPH